MARQDPLRRRLTAGGHLVGDPYLLDHPFRVPQHVVGGEAEHRPAAQAQPVEAHGITAEYLAVPMVVAVAYHLRPSRAEVAQMTCNCVNAPWAQPVT